ncbi:hypothetical protein ASE17_06370 [Phenylobacterium sp. Root77]|jgi:hypothetical protein|uniref:PEPxxWA-CTERM sorting domain-containing protein n=1 Tax=unclassified Phenylobacterium TaxID=2640670 RepID=UPI0006F65346|nr:MULTISPECIES: PEPxxWA-CTERM sorting domain-containing protein [unclassified Phenylobacterium]KQW68081.1 hypothetical protein ASC73_16275 [Phenylobacterium sp. Root1277]KQW91824.1 hypothetical protein ASC79_09650 [Phenylobacterium sp. Root1290]KRC40055.1 hypothetical protein ASE17_06370 [Phenylobacterium sp. Root77]
MKRLVAIAAAVAALAAAAPAWAAKTFVLDNVTLQGGGSLTGSFTTDDALSSLLSVNITASSGTFGPGVFSTFTYNNASLADWVSLPTQGFRISTAGYAQQLRLDFFPLTATGANILTTAYEYQNTGGARAVTGGRVMLDVPSAVPEPATWAMMIMGFGLAGAALRSRKAALAVA